MNNGQSEALIGWPSWRHTMTCRATIFPPRTTAILCYWPRLHACCGMFRIGVIYRENWSVRAFCEKSHSIFYAVYGRHNKIRFMLLRWVFMCQIYVLKECFIKWNCRSTVVYCVSSHGHPFLHYLSLAVVTLALHHVLRSASDMCNFTVADQFGRRIVA